MTRIPFALVLHANQYLITDGYENREGVDELLDGLTSLLDLHERLDVAFNLHMSGTLLETVLWHRPELLDRIRELRERGTLALIGGTYAENIMPVSSTEHNRRQLRESLWLHEKHLECDPRAMQVCWIPERVWSTELLAPVLTDATLANGGYRAVLLDDRSLFSIDGQYEHSPRALFDNSGPGILPWSPGETSDARPCWNAESCRAYTVKGGSGLKVIPFSAGLRYAIPPSQEDHWDFLRRLTREASEAAVKGSILVYADDLERVAGIGQWDARAPAQYEAFLQWLRDEARLQRTLLSDWIETVQDPPPRHIRDGTFYELARLWRAGEDYRGWWGSPAWQPYRTCFEDVEQALVEAAAEQVDPSLLDLAWKQFMASAYETGWHRIEEEPCEPAPWSRALASHARSAHVITAAARWVREPANARVEQLDIDQDGDRELILTNDRLFAVFSPSEGGRLVYLFERDDYGGTLLIGNPADDWNWQESLNRYMDRPANHPGALADVGFEHDTYAAGLSADHGAAAVTFQNIEQGSALAGSVKRVTLHRHLPLLAVCYRLPASDTEFSTDICLSPDYLRLLREGRRELRPFGDGSHRGYSNGHARLWVALVPAEDTLWDTPGQSAVGHGVTVRVTARSSHFHLFLGAGSYSGAEVGRMLDRIPDAPDGARSADSGFCLKPATQEVTAAAS